jgi:Na+/H+-translocating membrane pyrophosphatase
MVLDYNEDMTIVLETLAGFSWSRICFVCSVGGGIYTKAADVGADLVGRSWNSRG